MRYRILFTLLISYSIGSDAFAATPPPRYIATTINRNFHFGIHDVETFLGKKLSLADKIKLKILQLKLRKFRPEGMTDKQRKQAAWSMGLGIASILFLFTPIGILSIPAAVIGLVFGISSLRGNSNSKGIVGVITSSITLLLFLIALAFIAFIFSHGFFG